MNSYQPIPQLSCVKKILENVFHIRVYSFLEKFTLLYKQQFGFRSKVCKMDDYVSVIEDIRLSLNNKNKCAGFFVNLRKAFDAVNHQKLLKILEKVWMRGVLTNRRQVVKSCIRISDQRGIKCGVPQTSVLGQLLFIIHKNHFHFYCQGAETIMSAHDRALLFEGKDLSISTVESSLI